MVLFEVKAEMAVPEPCTYGETTRRIGLFCDALNIASSGFALNEYGLIMSGFTIGAASYRQAIWRGLEKIGIAAEAAGIQSEPVTFRLMRWSTQMSRASQRADVGCTCGCHDEESRMYTST